MVFCNRSFCFRLIIRIPFSTVHHKRYTKHHLSHNHEEAQCLTNANDTDVESQQHAFSVQQNAVWLITVQHAPPRSNNPKRASNVAPNLLQRERTRKPALGRAVWHSTGQPKWCESK